MTDVSAELGIAGGGGLAIVAAARLRGTETHGRWPWAAAALAPPVTVTAARFGHRLAGPAARPLVAALPLLLWHQTEEWVLPGGFLPWFNRSAWRSDEDEFPLTPPIALRVNVVGGWGVSAVAAAAAGPAPWLAGALFASHVANAALHFGRARIERAYNPGLLTGVPLGAVGVWGALSLASDRRARRRGAIAGMVAGLTASATLPLALGRRARSQSQSQSQSQSRSRSRSRS